MFQLKHFLSNSSNDSTEEFLHNIKSFRSAKLQIVDGFLCPDDSYIAKPFRIPGVVLEIAFSQSLKDLSLKAQRYLLHSQGAGVQPVIGVMSRYPTTNDLSIHVWRLQNKTRRWGNRLRGVESGGGQLTRAEHISRLLRI